MMIQRGVDLCGIEKYAWITKASTGDVPLGEPYEFDWQTSSDGKFSYSNNCSYTGANEKEVYTSTGIDCGTQCASTPNCVMFSWWEGWCNIKNSTQQVIALANGYVLCGYINSDDGSGDLAEAEDTTESPEVDDTTRLTDDT